MARLVNNSPLQGLRGKLGNNLIFRVVNEKTVVSQYVRSKKKSSDFQQSTRTKFGMASDYSKSQMRIPERKEYYKKLAKKLKLPNAYTAALTEYMRKPHVEEINVKKQKGGQTKIKVIAFKKGYKMTKVKLTVSGKDQRERHKMIENPSSGKTMWIADFEDFASVNTIIVEAFDEWNNCRRKIVSKSASGVWISQ